MAEAMRRIWKICGIPAVSLGMWLKKMKISKSVRDKDEKRHLKEMQVSEFKQKLNHENRVSHEAK